MKMVVKVSIEFSCDPTVSKDITRSALLVYVVDTLMQSPEQLEFTIKEIQGVSAGDCYDAIVDKRGDVHLGVTLS